MNALPTLIRREFWEHKALWIAPLVTAALLIIAAFGGHAQVNLPRDIAIDAQAKLALFALVQWVITLPQYMVMLIVLFFYLLDCLYAERRERSILFWKSMPVSDGQTVLAKLLVALVVVPLGVYLLALVTDLSFAGIIGMRFGASGGFVAWDAGVWLKLQAFMLLGLLVAMLWYAPIVAWLLLLSAWARRNVFLWVVLPPFLAVALEEISFGTERAADFLQYRLIGIWQELGIGTGLGRSAVTVHGERLPRIDKLFERIDATPVFGNIDLWLGLLVAVALVWGAIRIRRYRDDS